MVQKVKNNQKLISRGGGDEGSSAFSGLLSDTPRDARSHHRSICILWLDLKNACGSGQHSLILFALHPYGFPDGLIGMVRNHYDHLSVVIDVPGAFTSYAIHVELGVF